MGRVALLIASSVLLAVTGPPATSATSVLFDQTTPSGTSGSISAEDASGYHGETADDFTVPAGTQWTVNEVKALGFNSVGGGAIQPVIVRFYANAGGLPGAEEFRATVTIDTRNSALDIPLASPAVLGPGVHWLSVQIAHVTGAATEEWFWYNRGAQSGSPAAFRDPLGTTCLTWTVRGACGPGNGGSPDELFSLSGTSGPVTTGPPPATPSFDALVHLPSSHSCRPSRTLKFRLKRISGATVTQAVVKVGGKKKTITGARLAKPVKLRGLPTGTYKLKVILTLSTGVTVSGKRTYRTCPKP